jgi:hypothetical protein
MIPDGQVARLSDTDRIAEAIKRAVARLAPAVQAQFAALLTPSALATAAGFFVAWLVSHAVGVGFVVDAILMGVGVFSVGLSVFSGIDELIHFGRGALRARTDEDLNDAAGHLANAVGILGVQAIVGLLLRRVPQTFRNRGRIVYYLTGDGLPFHDDVRRLVGPMSDVESPAEELAGSVAAQRAYPGARAGDYARGTQIR